MPRIVRSKERRVQHVPLGPCHTSRADPREVAQVERDKAQTERDRARTARIMRELGLE
jgi:hypothetical protein